MKRSRPVGFTLVELLVVIAIIGVLVALLLPAIQAAREAARRVQCKNHVKQLALAAITHEEQIGHFPTGGWHAGWVGDKDRGFGQQQPGGWTFNILPFIEETTLYDLPGDGQPNRLTEAQLEGGGRLATAPPSILNCPSRRAPTPSAHYHDFRPIPIVNARIPELVGKSDYAVNAGERWLHVYRGSLASTLNAGASPDSWCNDALGNIVDVPSCFTDQARPSPLTGEAGGVNGVSFSRSEVGARHVTDGLTHTYLIGEKTVPPESYQFRQTGDLFAWCAGSGSHIERFGEWVPIYDPDALDEDIDGPSVRFGSAHSSGFHMSFCDGSVRAIEYGIDPLVHLAASNRKDGTFQGHP